MKIKTYKDHVFQEAMDYVSRVGYGFLKETFKNLQKKPINSYPEIEKEIFQERLIMDDDSFYWELKQVLDEEKGNKLRFGDWNEVRVFLDCVQHQAEFIAEEFLEIIERMGQKIESKKNQSTICL